MLKIRSQSEIEKVIYWGIPRKYWCVRLLTPEKLRKNFSEAFAEMTASEKERLIPELNKKKAKVLIKKIIRKDDDVRIEILNQYVEFLGASGQPTIVSYQSKNFEKELEYAVSKWRIQLK